MLAIGNDELGDAIKATITCPDCGEKHKVQYGDAVMKDGTTKPSKMLAYVKCPKNDKSYLVGIDGKEWK